MEATSALLMTLGAATLLASWVLLLIQTSRVDFSWALCSLLLPPLSYLYGLFRLDKVGESLGLALLGWIMVWLAF